MNELRGRVARLLAGDDVTWGRANSTIRHQLRVKAEAILALAEQERAGGCPTCGLAAERFHELLEAEARVEKAEQERAAMREALRQVDTWWRLSADSPTIGFPAPTVAAALRAAPKEADHE